MAVTGEDFSVRITLVEKSGASRPFVVATRGAIAAIRALTEHRTSIKELSLSLAMTGLRSEMAHATFASALGLAAPELGIANQRYLRRKRHRIGAERDGFLDVLFELATSGDHEDAHSLELRSQARAHSGSNSSDQEDWSILLGASLATVSSIIV